MFCVAVSFVSFCLCLAGLLFLIFKDHHCFFKTKIQITSLEVNFLNYVFRFHTNGLLNSIDTSVATQINVSKHAADIMKLINISLYHSAFCGEIK